MKKIYFAPEVSVVKIQNNSILCLSANAEGESVNYKGNSGDADGGLSRSFSFGDDE